MRPQEMGIVFNEFMIRRVISSGPFPSSRKTESEREALRILKRQASLEDFEEFLETQGFKLMEIALEAYGLGSGTAFVLLRDPRALMPNHLSPEHVLRELSDDRRTDTEEQTVIWAAFLFLVLMWFLYSKIGRGIEQVSLFDSAIVSLAEFTGEAEARIECLRIAKEGEKPEQGIVQSTLVSSNASMIRARCGGFLNGLARMGFLDKYEESATSDNGHPKTLYRQTFPAALDIAEHFTDYVGMLVQEAASRQKTGAPPQTRPLTDAIVADLVFVNSEAQDEEVVVSDAEEVI